jgi:formate dehydrogenase
MNKTEASPMSEKIVYSHCHYCVSLCGTKITVENNRVKNIEPDRENPMTWKDFCRKGKTAAEVVEHPQRIRTPMKRVGDRYVEASYEEAISDIASRLNAIIEQHGNDAVGTYHGNPLGFDFGGSLFFNGLLDALGTGNRFWVGSVDQNNTHIVQHAMYGSELISLPADIDECQFFLLLGMDPVQSKFGWLEVNPDGWNRVLAQQAKGAKVVVVDPRFSETAKSADDYIAIQPGQDWALVLGLLHVIFSENLQRESQTPLSGIEPIRDAALAANLGELADRCGVGAETIRKLARAFAQADTAMAIAHTGVGHNPNGTIGEWLVTVLNAVTNRLDTPGGRRLERSYLDLVKIFSSFAPPSSHRTRLKNLPAIAGFHALAELSDEILTPGQGQIRAMIIANGNPVISGPDSATLDKALGSLDLLVAVDLVQRDSHRHADWLIPGTHFLEREGLHCLFAGLMDKPFAQYANKAVDAPAGIMPEWQFYMELALAMGRPMFGKKGANSIIKASKFLAKITAKPNLQLNPQWLERILVASGKRIKYKDIRKHPHGWIFAEKNYGDLAKTLRTPDKTVHCSPPSFMAALQDALIDSRPVTSPDFPLIMVNKRQRESMNSWLNETQGMHSLNRGNTVDIHPNDAEALGLIDGQQVRISSPQGSISLPVLITAGGMPGVIAVGHGWGSTVYEPNSGKIAQRYGSNRNALVDRHAIDRFSQVPHFNSTAVRVEPIAAETEQASLIAAAQA